MRPLSNRVGRTMRVTSCIGAIAVTGAVLAGCGSSSSSTTATNAVAQQFNAGISAQKAGNYQQAVTDFTNVLAKYPNDAYAAYNLGVAQQALGNTAAAEAAYQKALSVNPKLTGALFNLATAQATDDPTAAIATYQRLLTILPNDPNTEFNLGLLLEQNGKKAAGRALLVKAIAKNPALRSRVPAGITLPK